MLVYDDGSMSQVGAPMKARMVAYLLAGFRLLRAQPRLTVWPVVLTLTSLALCLAIVLWTASVEKRRSRDEQLEDAEDALRQLTAVVDMLKAPLVINAQSFKAYPDVGLYLATWPASTVLFWSMLPMGAVRFCVSPQGVLLTSYQGGPGNAPGQLVNDTLCWGRAFVGNSSNQQAVSTVAYMDRKPVWVFTRSVWVTANESDPTWNTPPDVLQQQRDTKDTAAIAAAQQCAKGLCYDASTNRKWWGTVSIAFDVLHTPRVAKVFNDLLDRGYQVTLQDNSAAAAKLSASHTELMDDAQPSTFEWVGGIDTDELPVEDSAETFQQLAAMYRVVAGPASRNSREIRLDFLKTSQWSLFIWRPSWEGVWLGPVLVLVVVSSVLFGLLLQALIISREEHKLLLQTLVPKTTLMRVMRTVDLANKEDAEKSQKIMDTIALHTPAQQMLQIVASCLEGEHPSIPLLLSVKDVLEESQDVYRPTAEALKDCIVENEYVDAEVRTALMAQLTGNARRNSCREDYDDEHSRQTLQEDAIEELEKSSRLKGVCMLPCNAAFFSFTAAGSPRSFLAPSPRSACLDDTFTTLTFLASPQKHTLLHVEQQQKSMDKVLPAAGSVLLATPGGAETAALPADRPTSQELKSTPDNAIFVPAAGAAGVFPRAKMSFDCSTGRSARSMWPSAGHALNGGVGVCHGAGFPTAASDCSTEWPDLLVKLMAAQQDGSADPVSAVSRWLPRQESVTVADAGRPDALMIKTATAAAHVDVHDGGKRLGGEAKPEAQAHDAAAARAAGCTNNMVVGGVEREATLLDDGGDDCDHVLATFDHDGLACAAASPVQATGPAAFGSVEIPDGVMHACDLSAKGVLINPSLFNGGPPPISITAGEGRGLKRSQTFGAASSSTVRPDRVLLLKVETVLLTANEWTFDAFALHEATAGRPLSVLAAWLLHSHGLVRWAHMDVGKLVNFLQAVEEGYPDNPYHNRTHAADVLQSMHVIMTRGGLISSGVADKLSQLACYMAAIIHDIGHVGRNNDYLVRSHHDLAVRYNDVSPMENHHVAVAFSLLKTQACSCLGNLSKKAWLELRKTIIALVLATDMKAHFATLGQFDAIQRRTHHQPQAHMSSTTPNTGGGDTNGAAGSLARHSGVRLQKKPSVPSHATHNSGKLSARCSSESSSCATPQYTDSERLVILETALKCSDLGHLTAALPVHLRWVAALEQELFLQGDAERVAGLTLSPLCDRNKEGVTKSQVGFFDVVVKPLYKAFCTRFTGCGAMYTSLVNNYHHWVAEANAVASHSAGQHAATAASNATA